MVAHAETGPQAMTRLTWKAGEDCLQKGAAQSSVGRSPNLSRPAPRARPGLQLPCAWHRLPGFGHRPAGERLCPVDEGPGQVGKVVVAGPGLVPQRAACLLDVQAEALASLLLACSTTTLRFSAVCSGSFRVSLWRRLRSSSSRLIVATSARAESAGECVVDGHERRGSDNGSFSTILCDQDRWAVPCLAAAPGTSP
jgi:hypothetical protein